MPVCEGFLDSSIGGGELIMRIVPYITVYPIPMQPRSQALPMQQLRSQYEGVGL